LAPAISKVRWVLKSPYFWGFLVGAIALAALRPMQDMMRRAPPALMSVGEWSLIDHEGAPFGSEELAGKAYIADFIFTRCPSVCPGLTKAMQELDKRITDENIHLVSFSVDPEHDTPEVLRAYRAKNGIENPRWHFVTGTPEAVQAVLVGQMKLHVGTKEPLEAQDAPEAEVDAEAALYDIAHVARFALYDQRGDLRALATTDSHGLARLLAGAELLLDKGP
jgi:protein SCO1